MTYEIHWNDDRPSITVPKAKRWEENELKDRIIFFDTSDNVMKDVLVRASLVRAIVPLEDDDSDRAFQYTPRLEDEMV